MSEPARILCVEDEPDLLDDLLLELGDLGYATVAELDGLAALAQLAATSLDMIICDVQLPGLGGLEVLESVRQTECGKGRIPFILLTAYDDADFRRRAEELGADAYLVKPVDYAELEGIIARLLGQEHKV